MMKVEPIWKTKGFGSEYDYMTHLAKEKGYRSLEQEYKELWAKQRGFESSAGYMQSIIKKKGFESASEYQDYLAKKRGFASYIEYREHLAKEKGFKSLHEYYDHLAKLRGFDSYADYIKYLHQEHIAKIKGFESYVKYQEHKAKMVESIESQRADIKKKKACEFLQEKIAGSIDPESLFAKGNIDFLRKITGCKISLEKKKTI